MSKYTFQTEHVGEAELMWCAEHEQPAVVYDDESVACMYEDLDWGLVCSGMSLMPIDKRFPDKPPARKCVFGNRVMVGHDECHDMRGGSMVLCDACLAQAEKDYPQGWRGYPGDTCRHGRYTGGCGVDWMCGPCEMGEE